MANQGRINKIQKEGAESPILPPVWKLHFSGSKCSIQHCGRIRNAQQSNVNVSEDRIKEHFIKRFSGRLEGLGLYKAFWKCRGPLGQSPKSAYENIRGKLRNWTSLRYNNKAISRFRVRLPDHRSLTLWTTLTWYIGYRGYNPISVKASCYWLSKLITRVPCVSEVFISLDWPKLKSELGKSLADLRYDQINVQVKNLDTILILVKWDTEYWLVYLTIRSKFSLQLNCSEYIANSQTRLQGIPQGFLR